MSGALKPREQRVRVALPARMRDHRGWHDIRILNISPQGLMAQSPVVLSRGNFLELRRGSHVIVARVVWSNGRQFGAHTRSRLTPEAIINETGRPSARLPQTSSREMRWERRASPRPSNTAHEQSRWRSRTFEFIGIIALTALLGAFAYDASTKAFARPMKSVDMALGASERSAMPTKQNRR